MATLTASLSVSVQATHTNALDLETGTFPLANIYTSSYTSATVSKKFSDSRTTTGETLDLTSGLTDGYGAAIVATKLMILYIKNTHVSNDLTIGGGSNAVTPLTSATTVQPGGSYTMNSVAGYTVDSTHKNIVIATAGGASQTYDIIFIGN